MQDIGQKEQNWMDESDDMYEKYSRDYEEYLWDVQYEAYKELLAEEAEAKENSEDRPMTDDELVKMKAETSESYSADDLPF